MPGKKRKKIPLKDWRAERVKKGDLEVMNLLELSVISVMPEDVYEEIKKRISLALMLMEDGAIYSSREILLSFLRGAI
jgi:ASC-1-like (ASCH) protein